MVSSDFRAEARKKLEGKWGKAACITLAYLGFSFVLGFVLGLISGFLSLPDSIIDIIAYIFEIPLSFGFMALLLKLYNNEETKAFDFVKLGFNNFAKSWGVTFRIFLKMLLPIILFVVSFVLIGSAIALSYTSSSFGLLAILALILYIISLIWLICRSYSYQLSYFIAIDNPEMSSKDAVEKSKQLMNGNRGKLFCLGFSFIGWIIVCVIGLYIPILWILPYMQFAIIAFYKYLSGSNSNIEAEVIEENNEENI